MSIVETPTVRPVIGSVPAAMALRMIEEDGSRRLAANRASEPHEGVAENLRVVVVAFKVLNAHDVGVLLCKVLVVVPLVVQRRNTHDDEDVEARDVRKNRGECFGGVACFFVEVHVENHLAIEVYAQVLLQFGAGLGLGFLDGEVFLNVEVPNLVAHTELHADQLVGITVQESADSTGKVGVEHGVAVAGRGEQHLGGIQDAHF